MSLLDAMIGRTLFLINGVALPVRRTVNLVAGATAVDNTEEERLDITIDGSGGVGGMSGVLYVAKNGDDSTAIPGFPNYPYLTIQAAMNAATAGQVIQVGPGTWMEEVEWSEVDRITLRGCGMGTVINGGNPIAVSSPVEAYIEELQTVGVVWVVGQPHVRVRRCLMGAITAVFTSATVGGFSRTGYLDLDSEAGDVSITYEETLVVPTTGTTIAKIRGTVDSLSADQTPTGEVAVTRNVIDARWCHCEGTVDAGDGCDIDLRRGSCNYLTSTLSGTIDRSRVVILQTLQDSVNSVVISPPLPNANYDVRVESHQVVGGYQQYFVGSKTGGSFSLTAEIPETAAYIVVTRDEFEIQET